MAREKTAILSGVAGLITAVAALLAVFLNDAGDRADKADNKSDVSFQLLKQQFAYIEKDMEASRQAQNAQIDVLNRLSEEISVLRVRFDILVNDRRNPVPVPEVPEIRVTEEVMPREEDIPQLAKPVARSRLPANLDEVIAE